MKRTHLPPLLLWTLLCLLFFATVILGFERFPNSDLTGQFHAFGLFQAREVAAGHLPIWSPGSYGGFPFTADTQAAYAYPLRWLAIVLSLPWGYTFQVIQLEAVFHIWLTGVFTYLLAHDITGRRRAALLAAVAFGLGGYLTSYPPIQLALLESVTWLPLALLLVRQGTRHRQPLRWQLATGLTVGLSLLAGHPQTFMHVSYMVAAYFLYQSAAARWTWRSRAGTGGVIALTAIGTAAAAWLPALQYVGQTLRSSVSYEFVNKGFPLLDYVQMVMPSVLTERSPQYVSIVALLLALFAWTRRAHRQDKEIQFWTAAALLAAWLSLGDNGVLFEMIYKYVPGFSIFRQQERLVGIFSLGLALLAAQGLDLWLSSSDDDRVRTLRQPVFLIGFGLAAAGGFLAVSQPEDVGRWGIIFARQWAMLLAGWTLLNTRRIEFPRTVLILLVAALDLYFPVRLAMNLQPNNAGTIWSQPNWLADLDSDSLSRIDSGMVLRANIGEAYGLEDISGLSPLKWRALAQFEQLPEERRWQLLNVTHVISRGTVAESLTEVAVIDDGLLPGESVSARLYRFEDALPRAWMSYQPVMAADEAQALQVMGDPAFDPASEVVLTEAIAGLEMIAAPETPPDVRISRHAADGIDISVTTETPGLLVISEWDYPGWQATVNGKAAQRYTADYALQAIWLPAGSHAITLRFVPTIVYLGIAISLLTVILAAALSRGWHPAAAYKPYQSQKPRTALIPAGAGTVPPMRNWKPIIFLVLLLGFGLRLHNLGVQELRGDEAFSYIFASMDRSELIPTLITEGDPHAPLHYLLLHGWMQLTGDSEFSMRFVSLLAGVLLLPLLFKLGVMLVGRHLGILMALFAALSQSLVWVAQDVRNQYTLTILFATLATILLLRLAGSRGADPSRSRRIGSWILYAVAIALAIYSHYYGVFVLAGHAAYILSSPEHRRAVRPWLVSLLAAALLFAPWPAAVWSSLVQAGQLSDPGSPELARYLTAVGIESVAGRPFDFPIGRWLFLGALALGVVGARDLNRRRAFSGTLLLAWLSTAALAIYLIQFRRATFNTFYITVAAPAWWALVAAGMTTLWQRRSFWLKSAAALSGAALVTAAAISLTRYYTEPEFQRSVGYRGIAQHIQAQQQPGDVFVANFPDPSFVYYLRDLEMDYEMQPAAFNSPVQQTEGALKALAETHNRLWFVPAFNPNWDSEDVALSWLGYNTVEEQEILSQKLTLMAFRSPQLAGSIMVPLDATIEDKLRLNGVHITVNGEPADPHVPPTLVPGDVLQATLVLESLDIISESYTVFVHLSAEDGWLLAQHDGIPAGGVRPTTTWQPGEKIVDVHQLVVPAGIQTRGGWLHVGIYRTESVERLRFTNGQDTIPLARILFSAQK